MGSKKTNELNISGIVSKIGFPLSKSEFRNTYKYNVNVERVMEFERKLKTAQGPKDTIDIMSEYEDIFDKWIYVLHVGRLLKKDIENLKRFEMLEELPKQQVFTNDPTGKNKRRTLITARTLLKGKRVAELTANSATGDIIVYTSEEFASESFSTKKRAEKAEARIKQIDEALGLENVLQYITPPDLIEICEYPNLGNVLAVNLYELEKDGEESNKKEYKSPKKKDRSRRSRASNEVKVDISKDEFDKEKLKDIIIKYAEFIDLDKLLLMSNALYYNMQDNNSANLSQEEAEDLQVFTEKVGELLASKKTVLESKRFSEEIKYALLSESVSSLNRHFIGGKFYSYEELNDLIVEVIDGNYPISTVTKREFRNTLQLTVEEISILTRNDPNALMYLLENDMLEKDEVEDLVALKRGFSNEEILCLLTKEMITKESIEQLYAVGKITLENIEYIKMNSEEDLSDLVNDDRLVELYLNAETESEFDKYRGLYYTLVVAETAEEAAERLSADGDEEKLKELERKQLERRKEIGNRILDKSLELLNDEAIYDLYHMGLLPIDTVIDFMGAEAATKMFVSGELKPIDARRLYEETILTESVLDEIFKKDDLNDTQKLVLIYSTFPTDSEEDLKARNKYMSYMSDVVARKEVSEKEGTTHKSQAEDILEQNKYITDPCARWNLIASIDKDYSQEYLKDGHIVFYLPNEKKFVIEKLYDKGLKPAYGSATYIVDEAVFIANRNEIVNEESINKRFLVRIHKEKAPGISKLIHTGWESALIKYFDIENSKTRTESEKKKIKSLAKRVEKSKKPMTAVVEEETK